MRIVNQKNDETNEEINLNLMSQSIIARNINRLNSEYVFQSPHSLKGGLGDYKKAFGHIKKEAKLETGIHSLRHTFCTNVARKCKSSKKSTICTTICTPRAFSREIDTDRLSKSV